MLTTKPKYTSYLEVSRRVNEIQKSPEILIVVGGGMLQVATFFETALMGIATLLIDKDENCFCRSFANYFLSVSIHEPYQVIRGVNDFVQKNPDRKIVGVYTQGCDAEFTVATLAEHLSLPGIGAKVARACNNKIETRIKFMQNYIPQPFFSYVENEEFLKDIVKEIGYPCVFKPVDNCASRGLSIVQNEDEIRSAFEEAVKNSKEPKVLIERFIEGKEYSVDTIIYQNRLYPCGISDREFIQKDNYAVQSGSLTPSLLPTEKQEEIYNLMEEAAKALKINNSAFKGDIIIDQQGKVYILEVTARLSGGFDSQYRKPLSFGVNLIKATIDLALGRELDFRDIVPKWVKFSKTFHIFPKPGIIKKVEGLDEFGHIRGVQGIHKIFWSKNIGNKVNDYRTCADRVVHIIGYADTLEELRQIEKNVTETLQIITE